MDFIKFCVRFRYEHRKTKHIQLIQIHLITINVNEITQFNGDLQISHHTLHDVRSNRVKLIT